MANWSTWLKQLSFSPVPFGNDARSVKEVVPRKESATWSSAPSTARGEPLIQNKFGASERYVFFEEKTAGECQSVASVASVVSVVSGVTGNVIWGGLSGTQDLPSVDLVDFADWRDVLEMWRELRIGATGRIAATAVAMAPPIGKDTSQSRPEFSRYAVALPEGCIKTLYMPLFTQ